MDAMPARLLRSWRRQRQLLKDNALILANGNDQIFVHPLLHCGPCCRMAFSGGVVEGHLHRAGANQLGRVVETCSACDGIASKAGVGVVHFKLMDVRPLVPDGDDECRLRLAQTGAGLTAGEQKRKPERGKTWKCNFHMYFVAPRGPTRKGAALRLQGRFPFQDAGGQHDAGLIVVQGKRKSEHVPDPALPLAGKVEKTTVSAI